MYEPVLLVTNVQQSVQESRDEGEVSRISGWRLLWHLWQAKVHPSVHLQQGEGASQPQCVVWSVKMSYAGFDKRDKKFCAFNTTTNLVRSKLCVLMCRDSGLM